MKKLTEKVTLMRLGMIGLGGALKIYELIVREPPPLKQSTMVKLLVFII